MRRIWALAVITFKEGVRSRAVYGIGLFSLFILCLNIAVAGFFMRDVGKVTVDMNLSALSVAGLLLVLFVGLNLIAKDIERKTIQLVLSKPISRYEYILGKYFGIELFVLAALFLLFVVSCLNVYGLSIAYQGYFHGFDWGNFFLAAFFVYLKISVLVAIVVFFGVIATSSFITLIFSFCAYIVGETIEEVVFYLRSSASSGEAIISDNVRRVIDATSYIAPNFSVFDFKPEAAYGLPIATGRVWDALGYGLVYISILLILAALVFQRREFN